MAGVPDDSEGRLAPPGPVGDDVCPSSPAGARDGGVHGGLQPGQHQQDEAGAVHGRRAARVLHQPHPAPAAGQRAAAGGGGQRTAVPHQAGLPHVGAQHTRSAARLCVSLFQTLSPHFRTLYTEAVVPCGATAWFRTPESIFLQVEKSTNFDTHML